VKQRLAGFGGWSVLAIAVALGCAGTADARNLVRVAIPEKDFHDPLYVDAQSILWNGSVVTFTYVLDVPILGQAGEQPRFRSNGIELKMDCVERTKSLISLTTYSGRAGTGDEMAGFVANAEERVPERIDMRPGSTLGYLFRHLCKRAR
jgi:hypothetical protein